MEQIDLFEEAILKSDQNDQKVFSQTTPLIVKEFHYVREQHISVQELFSGYQTIRILSFSTGLSFIDKLLSLFDYGEILIGSHHLANKEDIQALVSRFAGEYDFVATQASSHPTLLSKMKNEEVYLKVANNMVHHEKLYLLASDDGRYRVIYASANATNQAWSGSQGEFYNYCDGEDLYLKELAYFTTIWNESVPIEENNIATSPHQQHESPFLKQIKKEMETKELFVVTQAHDEESLIRTRYGIQSEIKSEEYKQILKGLKGTKKKGIINIHSKEIIRIIKRNKEKIQRKQALKRVDYGLPKMNVWDQKDPRTIQLDDKGESLIEHSLLVSKDKLKISVQTYLDLMNTYNPDVFNGDIENLKETHFKVLALLFSSIFHARLRIEANLRNLSIDALPLFITLTSTRSNSGKTFMVRAILKMMSGKMQDIIKGKNTTINSLRAFIELDKPYLPILIDEMDPTVFHHYKNMMKSSDSQASQFQYHHPIFIFTGNALCFEDSVRKRAPIFYYSSKLSKKVDENKMSSLGNTIINSLTTDFYFEYLRRMIPLVYQELDYLSNPERPDDYYPTLVGKSSQIIMDIVQDCGFPLPAYMKVLNWAEDFAGNAIPMSQVIKTEIKHEFKQNPKAFKFKGEKIYITLPANAENEKMIKRWMSLLPDEVAFTELTANYPNTRLFSLNKNMLKEHMGIELKQGHFNLKKWF